MGYQSEQIQRDTIIKLQPIYKNHKKLDNTQNNERMTKTPSAKNYKKQQYTKTKKQKD